MDASRSVSLVDEDWTLYRWHRVVGGVDEGESARYSSKRFFRSATIPTSGATVVRGRAEQRRVLNSGRATAAGFW